MSVSTIPGEYRSLNHLRDQDCSAAFALRAERQRCGQEPFLMHNV